MEQEKIDLHNNEGEVSFDKLQEFFNDPELEIDDSRRDLSKIKNLKWLDEKILTIKELPTEHWRAFRRELASAKLRNKRSK